MQTKRLKKLALLSSLYVSQYIPVTFLHQALPVFMRQQGLSLDAIGFLPLLGLPLMLKFLWSPLIDRYGFTRWGHYRFWIICFQLLAAAATVGCAWLNVDQTLSWIMLGMFVIAVCCSSQDIATDALAVGLLEPQERGWGNGIQNAGNYLGGVIGAGGMLLLLDRWGWTGSVLGLALIMVVALIPVLNYRERSDRPAIPSPAAPRTASPVRLVRNYLKTLTDFCRRPGMGIWLLMLVLYTAGGIMASTMFNPLLVDIGLSLSEIGVLLGIVSYGSGIGGAILGGWLISRWGRKRSLVRFGLLNALTMTAYLLPAYGITDRPLLYLIAIAIQIANSMATTALLTVMMDKSKLATAGTDYTVQTAMGYFSSIGAAAVAGVIAQAIGYRWLFVISIGVALLSVAIISKRFHETNAVQPAIATTHS